MSIAWVFPGQGSQKLGMAEPIMNLPGALERFKFASSFLDRDLLAICEGKTTDLEELPDLNDTRNTQPGLFVIESLLVDDLHRQGRQASLVAGHSLGELVALYAAKVFDLETSLMLLKRRSELMAASTTGTMSAVIGFKRDQLEELVASTEGVVIANDNSSAQVVLSGSDEAVQVVTSHLDCKRIIPLAVSGAFHSPFMNEAAKEFAKELDKVTFNDATIPVISNSEPSPTCDGIVLKNRLKNQMTSGVRWRETMDVFQKNGITNLLEIGPGNVLSGLAKRSMKGVTSTQLSSASDLGY